LRSTKGNRERESGKENENERGKERESWKESENESRTRARGLV
jgi:hypothetical protein